MSVCCVECFVGLGCLRWGWNRCTHIGADDSATWPLATADEFELVPHLCRLTLAVYEENLRHPQFPPLGGYRLNPDFVVKRVTYEQTLGHAPPYLIYLDHTRLEIVMAIRGLNLKKESDYKMLLDNQLGKHMFDGGFVHHGLLKSAVWLLNEESENLRRLWVENGSCYKMVFVGHSLGGGVAALLTVLVVNHLEMVGGISREMVKCYAIAPTRCLSLNLAVKYADVIYSIILQISFSQFSGVDALDSLPCLLFVICMRDTFIPEDTKLKDPRRLYAPGRMYHIVDRKFCRCGRYPPEVRTAIPVDGRFEHIVLSCNATSDHAIIWIQREAEKALQILNEKSSESVTIPPKLQRFDRLQSIEKEHKVALERAVSLKIPHAVTTKTPDEEEKEPLTKTSEECYNQEELSKNDLLVEPRQNGDGPNSKPTQANWNDLVERLLGEQGSSHKRPLYPVA
ncbi:Lipase, class 3 [Cynara cardunculus var. scolymus]|uniref:Lipase, class 3 n=1 Tax=Cynara cardunculus var. scolymus TaxID=59895 RepID=A0A124SBY7_CYNCS|nr:Lipase, class 3 [Cynara cardunculus var. scolymus]